MGLFFFKFSRGILNVVILRGGNPVGDDLYVQLDASLNGASLRLLDMQAECVVVGLFRTAGWACLVVSRAVRWAIHPLGYCECQTSTSN